MEQGISALTASVTTAWILVAVSLLALGTLAYSAIRRRVKPASLQNAVEAVTSVDIEAFRNLIDPAEEAFLRDQLPPNKFREIKRQRAWAALIYTWEVGRSARAMALAGQAMRRSTDPAVSASGVQITEDAFQLRLDTIRASFRFVGEILMPGLKGGTLPSLLDRYRHSAETLLRLQDLSPARVVSSKSA